MAAKRIKSTKNYRLFQRSEDNRPTEIRRRKKLVSSMKRYGFLWFFPIVVWPDGKGKFVIREGQHRFAVAESLGLEIFYVEADIEFDIATVNCTAKTWRVVDYARTFAAKGLKQYQEAQDFAAEYGIALGRAFALLGGTTSFTNVESRVYDGTFRIVDREWAAQVAELYSGTIGLLTDADPAKRNGVRNARFLEACMACCRVDDFDSTRFLQNAARCREKLIPFSTRDAYLQMMEEVYNFGRKKLFGLKSAATMAMRERNPAKKS